MWIYICIFTTAATITVFLEWLVERTIPNFIIFFVQFILTFAYGLTWKLGRKYQSEYVLMIAALYLLAHILMAIAIDLVLVTFETKWIGFQSRISGTLIYSILVAPSLRFIAFYIVVFFINILQVVWRHIPKDERLTWIRLWILVSIMVVSFWFIF